MADIDAEKQEAKDHRDLAPAAIGAAIAAPEAEDRAAS